MKKTILSVFLLCSLCLTLCSCNGYEKEKTFSEEFLKSVSLEEMPLPEIEKCSLNSNTEGVETLKIDTDLGGFEAYIRSFIEYMNSREDIYYFGVQESNGLIAEMLPHRLACQVKEYFRWENGTYWYTFAYSLTDELAEHNSCSEHKAYKDPIIVKFEYDAEEKQAFVNITQGSAFATDCIDESLIGE